MTTPTLNIAVPDEMNDDLYPEPRSERVCIFKTELATALGLGSDASLNRLEDLILAHLRRARRRIAPAPRRVAFAANFWDSALAQTRRAEVEALVHIIEAGADLDPYLSARAHAPGVHPRDRQHDGDYALAAYGVHHLHFDPIVAGQARSREGEDALLFAAFRPNAALLLVVGDHRSFHDGTVENAVVRARSEAGMVIRGIQGLTRPTEDARERTRQGLRGINTLADVDGQFTVSSMMSAANTSFETQRMADRAYITIVDFDPDLDDLVRARQRLGLRVPEAAQFAWRFEGTRLILYELITSTRFAFSE